MAKLNQWLTVKFMQYDSLNTSSKIFVWLFGFLIYFSILLLIAGICYECHVPLYNGWTQQYIVKL